MQYFDGIQFIDSGSIPRSRGFTDCQECTYGIHYNHSGNLLFATGDNNLELYEGSWAFISCPGVRIKYGCPEEESRYHNYVNFRGPRVEQYLQAKLLPITASKPRKIVHNEKFLHSMLELIANHNQDTGAYEKSVHLLEGLLLEFRNQQQITAIQSYLTPRITELSDKILSNPNIDWDFKKEAARINISYSHFRKLFRKALKVPPRQFLIQCRLNLAAEMLRNSSKQVRAVAEKCGIPDEYYFSRSFKKHFHFSPSIYRQKFSC